MNNKIIIKVFLVFILSFSFISPILAQNSTDKIDLESGNTTKDININSNPESKDEIKIDVGEDPYIGVKLNYSLLADPLSKSKIGISTLGKVNKNQVIDVKIYIKSKSDDINPIKNLTLKSNFNINIFNM